MPAAAAVCDGLPGPAQQEGYRRLGEEGGCDAAAARGGGALWEVCHGWLPPGRLGAAVAGAAVLLLLGAAAAGSLGLVGRSVTGPWGRLAPAAPGALSAGPGGCGVNVILARHCNKRPPWDEHPTPLQVCTTEGLLRGENMARIFGTAGKFPAPTRLFARRLPTGTYSSRDLYLLWPVAQRYGLQVNTTFGAKDMPALAEALLGERPALCGHTVLVSWDHCSLPALAQALGCRDRPCMTCWDDRDYDTLFWLHYEWHAAAEDWQLSVQVRHENFGGFDGPSSYRQCIGNPAEGSNFGFPCAWSGGGVT